MISSICRPYSQSPLRFYQIEIVPVLILDQNTQSKSYTDLCISKPYTALNEETYISLRHQDL